MRQKNKEEISRKLQGAKKIITVLRAVFLLTFVFSISALSAQESVNTTGANFSGNGGSKVYSQELQAQRSISSLGSKYHNFTNLNNHSVDVSQNWTPLGIRQVKEIYFTKEHSDTKIEVIFNSRVNGGMFAPANRGIRINATINDGLPDYGTQGSVVTNNTTEYISFFSVFVNLPAGTHTLKIVARASNTSSTGVLVDPGGWGGGIIVKEIR